MEKQYYHSIVAKMSPTNVSTATYTVTARNVLEAKNKFKASWPNAKIISCVRKGEYTPPNVHKPKESVPLFDGGSLLGGLAVAAGAAVLSHFWKKKTNENE